MTFLFFLFVFTSSFLPRVVLPVGIMALDFFISVPVLAWVSIAEKRHHDQGKSYKGHLIGAGLQVLRFSPLSSQQEAQQCPGRPHTRGAESSTTSSKGILEHTVLRQLEGGTQSPPPQ